MAKDVSLSQVIKSYINNFAEHMRTALPATILTYDAATQKASVQPMIHRLDSDGTLHKPAVMYGIPIMFPSAGTGTLTFPIKTGDQVLLVISDRSLDNYMYSEGKEPVDPNDLKTHDLSDAIAIAGFYPYKRALGIHTEDVVLRMNAGENNTENDGENSLHLLPKGKNEAIILHANQYNGNHSVIKILQNGDINIDTLQGTNILLNQAGDVTINTPTKVVVNSGGDTVVNATGNVTVDGSNIILNGGSGGGVVTSTSINHVTGLPHGDCSGTVTCDY